MTGKSVERRGRCEEQHRPAMLPWVLRLRWSALVCRLLLVLGISLLLQTRMEIFSRLGLPLFIIATLFFFEGTSNGLLMCLHRRGVPVPTPMVGMIFFLDILLLTGMLFFTGGALNPFIFLYVIHIVFAAMILPGQWTLGLTIWTLFCYLLLLPPAFRSLRSFPGMGGASGFDPRVLTQYIFLYLQGHWIAFGITVFFLIYFIDRIRREAERKWAMERHLARERSRNEKLASLTALAAGAAHELSTPLSTIAVAAGEMLDNPEEPGKQSREDVELIRDNIVQCKEILYEMAAGAGEHRGEEVRKFTIDQAIGRITRSLPRAARRRLRVQEKGRDTELILPFRSFCRVVRSLLKNGLESTEKDLEVRLQWRMRDQFLLLTVKDEGKGMEEGLVARACDPFFSTKESGMGLGLFLARTLAERFGGGLEIASTPASGTTVTLRLRVDGRDHSGAGESLPMDGKSMESGHGEHPHR